MEAFASLFNLIVRSKTPPSLAESIRLFRNASAGFRVSWQAGDRDEALQTSEDAFKHLDHIQNELLRRRDEYKKRAGWTGSSFQTAIAEKAGRYVVPTAAEKAIFAAQAEDCGSIPSGLAPIDLSLETALNKLKHRSTGHVKFSLSPGGHHLYVFTLAGAGQPDTISEIELGELCRLCKAAAAAT